jgi:YVTN family beta-propeller protein
LFWILTICPDGARRRKESGLEANLLQPSSASVGQPLDPRINMFTKALFLTALAALSVSPAPALLLAQETPSPALLVLSKGEQMLKIVDPATGKVVGQAPSGPDPHEVIASADGTRAYITNYGGDRYHTLTVVDLVARENLPTVDLGELSGPHGIEFAGGKVWFTSEGAEAVGSYDPVSNRVQREFATGQEGTHMLIVASDQSRIVTTNMRSGTVSILERDAAAGGVPKPADWRGRVVRAGGGVEGFDVSPDGKEIWAANGRDGTISIIDPATKRVVQTLDVKVGSANRLKFTPDGTRVFVSMLRSPEVAVFDVASRAELKRIPVGRGAAGILVQPDGARVYVACTPDDYVAIIDPRSLEVVGRIEAGRQPDGLAWAVRR